MTAFAEENVPRFLMDFCRALMIMGIPSQGAIRDCILISQAKYTAKVYPNFRAIRNSMLICLPDFPSPDLPCCFIRGQLFPRYFL